jgi:hypothetical protein
MTIAKIENMYIHKKLPNSQKELPISKLQAGKEFLGSLTNF